MCILLFHTCIIRLVDHLFKVLESSRLRDIVNMPVDEDNTSLLHLSVKDQETTITQLLIDKGACINHQNDDGIAPLHVAAMNGATKCISLLLTNGANPLLHDVDGMTSFDYAEDENEIECLKLLNRHITCEAIDDLSSSICETYVSLMTAEIENQDDNSWNCLAALSLVGECEGVCTVKNVVDNG